MKKTNCSGDGYALSQSPLFGIRSKRRLAEVLHWSGAPAAIVAFAKQPNNYERFQTFKNPDKPRHVEAPKAGLKRLQKRAESLLKRVHLPNYLHSGRSGRSYLSNSFQHASVPGCTVTLDISDFYLSITTDRLERLFIVDFACSRDVAMVLADLFCCDGHLATGSPASPLLSFLAFRTLFDAIDARAKAVGGLFTLYIDDIAVTGQGIGREEVKWITQLLARERLAINRRKSRVFPAGGPRLITGRVLSDGVSRAPNKQHLKYMRARIALRASPSDSELRASFIGRARHIALLDDERRVDLRKHAKAVAAGGQ